MTSVVTTASAERDLADIANYIADHNPDVSLRLIAEVRRVFESLSNAPMRHRLRPDYGGGRRRVNCRDYAILYVYDERRDVVEIERVIHGRRNILAMLRP